MYVVTRTPLTWELCLNSFIQRARAPAERPPASASFGMLPSNS